MNTVREAWNKIVRAVVGSGEPVLDRVRLDRTREERIAKQKKDEEAIYGPFDELMDFSLIKDEDTLETLIEEAARSNRRRQKIERRYDVLFERTEAMAWESARLLSHAGTRVAFASAAQTATYVGGIVLSIFTHTPLVAMPEYAAFLKAIEQKEAEAVLRTSRGMDLGAMVLKTHVQLMKLAEAHRESRHDLMKKIIVAKRGKGATLN